MPCGSVPEPGAVSEPHVPAPTSFGSGGGGVEHYRASLTCTWRGPAGRSPSYAAARSRTTYSMPRHLFGYQHRQRVSGICQTVRKHAQGRRLVDFGCAKDNIAKELAMAGFEVPAVDRNQAFLDYARSTGFDANVKWVHFDLQRFRRGASGCGQCRRSH